MNASEEVLRTHFEQHQKVVADSLDRLMSSILATSEQIVSALQSGRKLIAFGNGGSATQASHLAGELIGRFDKTRRPLPALALVGDPGAVTCIANDFGYETLFERQSLALAEPGDVVIGLTTSGRSENVLRGLAAAKKKGALTIALVGDVLLGPETADYPLPVPSKSTAYIQEVHLMIIHVWCRYIDLAFQQY